MMMLPQWAFLSTVGFGLMYIGFIVILTNIVSISTYVFVRKPKLPIMLCCVALIGLSIAYLTFALSQS